jgi:hypothetical protein
MTLELARTTIALVERHEGNISKAARAESIPRETLQSRYSRAKQLLSRAALPPDEELPTGTDATLAEREKRRFEDRIKLLERELIEARKEASQAEDLRETILGLSRVTPKPPEWLLDSTPGGSAPGVPCVIFSDWHWGEVVRPEEVAHVNQFNLTIAHARVQALVTRIIDLCFHHMVNPTYPGIVVCLGGDMISGDMLHDEITESNEQPTAVVLLDLQDVLIWAIGALADKFGSVFLPCVVGNHGRMTHKKRAKGRVHTSYEWLLYCQLERYFRNDSRVQFMIPGETDAHFRIYGHRYMLTHGDSLGVKGGDGIIGLLGPVTRGTIKVRNSEAQIGRDFDTIIMGHWHQWLPLPGCIVNGALKGYDEYARLELRARYQPPIQAMWFTHRKWGLTMPVPIFLEEPRTVPSDTWITWQQQAS